MAVTLAPYLPFDGGRFRLAMGLLPLPIAEWFEIDARLTDDLAAKRALLETRHDEVFAALPEAGAPATELLAMLAEHLPHHHPAHYRRAAGDILVNMGTEERWNLTHPSLHPLDLAGRLVQEDLCLLSAASDGTYRLVGASLCSPARWRLADKIGKPLGAIHEPVPGYAESLERPVDRFFTHLKADKLVWRLNWSINDDPTPFQPTGRPCVALSAEEVGERLWLRVERQTLRRLPQSSAVLFTIRTHITRLDAAIRNAEHAAELAEVIRTMPAANRAYKQIAPVASALLAWLDGFRKS